VTLWLATRLLASAAVTGPLNSPGVVLPVELNGVSSFFGHQRAFFVLNQPDQPGPCSFTLAVGESRFGIKLLAVNEALDHVEIENGGQKQTLRIRSATASAQPSPITELTGFAAKLTIRKIGGISPGENPGADPAVEPSHIPGNPGFGTIPQIAKAQSSPKQNSIAGSRGAGLAAVAPQDQINADWYEDAAIIEASRKRTAAEVLAGEMTPWPRTPLTPPGTPGELIGDDGVFGSPTRGFYPQ
jgi:hypothetical protein